MRYGGGKINKELYRSDGRKYDSIRQCYTELGIPQWTMTKIIESGEEYNGFRYSLVAPGAEDEPRPSVAASSDRMMGQVLGSKHDIRTEESCYTCGNFISKSTTCEGKCIRKNVMVKNFYVCDSWEKIAFGAMV